MPEPQEGQQQEPSVTGAGVTFDLPADPPEGGEGGEGGEPGGEPPKPNRKERQAARGESFATKAREWEERARRAEEANTTTARELAELRGRFEERDRLQKQGEKDPDAAALEAAEERMAVAVARMSTGQTAEELTAAKRDWLSAQREVARIVARQETRNAGKEIEDRVTGKIPAQVDPGMASILADFPFMSTDESARAVANGYVAQLVKVEGRNMNDPSVRLATLREGAAHAAQVLKLGGGRAQVTDVDRDRLAGTSGRDSGAGNAVTRVSLNDDQKAMAEQMFRSLPREQAYQEWWKKIGSRIQNK